MMQMCVCVRQHHNHQLDTVDSCRNRDRDSIIIIILGIIIGQRVLIRALDKRRRKGEIC